MSFQLQLTALDDLCRAIGRSEDPTLRPLFTRMKKQVEQEYFSLSALRGWIPTSNVFPADFTDVTGHIYHPSYGTLKAVYTSADWEDKSRWKKAWQRDWEYLEPRRGWAVDAPDGGLMLANPQPTYYLPDVPAQ